MAGGETVYTDVDGRYVVDLAPGTYEIKVSMDGYETKTLKVDVAAGARVIDANVGLSMTRFAETVTVTAPGFFMDAVTSSAEAHDGRAQERGGHHRQHGLAGHEEERRHRRGGGDVARHRVVGRR